VDRATAAFTALVGERSRAAGFVAVALLLAVVLGAAHALAPGHGKTVMAAYLVGLRGTLRQAATIGATVTLTHTAGVLLLGLVLSTTRAVASERVYPWLGLGSGLLLAAVGLGLLARARPGGHAQARGAQARAAEAEPATGRPGACAGSLTGARTRAGPGRAAHSRRGHLDYRGDRCGDHLQDQQAG